MSISPCFVVLRTVEVSAAKASNFATFTAVTLCCSELCGQVMLRCHFILFRGLGVFRCLNRVGSVATFV